MPYISRPTEKSRSHIRWDGGNRRITFTVTDSGPGIPACEAEHIFGRFVKLDTFSQGLGLGLTVCRLIASALAAR